MTMRGAHYTCPNDTVMTNKWHSATAVTNLCPTITYLAPAAITNYISQTRRPEVRKPGSLSPKKGCFLFHNSDFCNRKLTLTDFSRLFSALVRRRHGRMPTFFHLWPYFHLSQFFPSQFGGKEKLIFVTYSEPCTPGTSIFSCDFQKGRRNRSFWHIPWCTPAQGYCPLSHCQCTFQFWLGGHTIFLFGWFCTNTSLAHIAICIFQRHISLCYSNFKFVISKYFFD